MKLACLLLVALCPATLSYCQTWKRTGVENTGREILYNPDNITIQDIGQHKNVIKTWFKEQFAYQNVSGILYSTGYTLTFYAFDCNEKIWSIDELIFCKPSGEVIQCILMNTSGTKLLPGLPWRYYLTSYAINIPGIDGAAVQGLQYMLQSGGYHLADSSVREASPRSWQPDAILKIFIFR